MKQLLFLMGFVCLIAMILPGCAPAPEPEPEAAPEPALDQAAEEAAIREVQKQIYATWNAHDAKANAAFDDEKFEEWDGMVKGPAADEKQMEDIFQREKDIQRNMLEEIGFVFVTPEVAIYKLRSEFTGSLDQDGNPQPPLEFLHAMVFVKRHGKWLYAAPFTRPIEE